jgi:hypothetical protein
MACSGAMVVVVVVDGRVVVVDMLLWCPSRWRLTCVVLVVVMEGWRWWSTCRGGWRCGSGDGPDGRGNAVNTCT